MQLRKIWQFLEAYINRHGTENHYFFSRPMVINSVFYKQKFALKFEKNAGVV